MQVEDLIIGEQYNIQGFSMYYCGQNNDGTHYAELINHKGNPKRCMHVPLRWLSAASDTYWALTKNNILDMKPIKKLECEISFMDCNEYVDLSCTNKGDYFKKLNVNIKSKKSNKVTLKF